MNLTSNVTILAIYSIPQIIVCFFILRNQRRPSPPHLFIVASLQNKNRLRWRISHQRCIDWYSTIVESHCHAQHAYSPKSMKRCHCWNNCRWSDVRGSKHMISLCSRNCHSWRIWFCAGVNHWGVASHTEALRPGSVLLVYGWVFAGFCMDLARFFEFVFQE